MTIDVDCDIKQQIKQNKHVVSKNCNGPKNSKRIADSIVGVLSCSIIMLTILNGRSFHIHAHLENLKH